MNQKFECRSDLSSFRVGGPVAVILFGGEAVHATGYFSNIEESSKLKSDFAKWKVCTFVGIVNTWTSNGGVVVCAWFSLQ